MKLFKYRDGLVRATDARRRKWGAVGMSRTQQGFTLVEMTMVLAMLMVLAAALMMMLQSHVTFMRVLSSYSFLRDDAPQVNNMLTGIFGKADSYRIYSSTSSAKANTGEVNTGGTAVRLRFRNPNGTFDEGIVAFETVSGVTKLNFYNYDGSWSGTPNWTITQQPTAVTFADDTGILLVTMTGPHGEQVTYGGTGE